MAQLDVKKAIKDTGQNIKDTLTFKKQRQNLSDAISKEGKSLYDKYIPNALKPKPPPEPLWITKPKATPTPTAKPGSFKKGGVVQKTGMAKVHKGEKVLTEKQAKSSKKGK